MSTKKKRILFGVGILILVCCIFAGSYAFWTVTKEQNDTNNLVAACLDLELIEETGTFGVNNAWPISDEEGLELEGYSFKVKNNCSETVNYIIGIDSLAIEGADYLSYDSIKVSLDSASPKVFGSLTDVERDNVRGRKQVEIKSIEGNSTNSHNIKLWIKDTVDVSEQSKQFKGQVFITGGQGINLSESNIVATGDISATSNDHVTYNLLSDGSLNIDGIGNIKSFSAGENLSGGILTDIINQYIADHPNDFSDEEKNLLTTEMLGGVILVMTNHERLIPLLTGGAATTAQDIKDNALQLGGNHETADAFLSLLDHLSEIPVINNVTFSNGITNVGESMFEGLKIGNINLSNTITTIESYAFHFFTSSSFNFPTSLETIKRGTFNDSLLGITEIIFPNTLATIEICSFSNANITKLKLPENLLYTTFDNNIFCENNPNMTIVVPSTINKFSGNGLSQTTLNMMGSQRTIDGLIESNYLSVNWNYSG